MADTKISALTGASTPLTGTEVLPIVQSGATVKVAVSDLTAGRAVATAALSATGIVLTSDATDASSTTAASLKTAGGLAVVKKIYVGDNIVPAAAKGVNFTANTPAAGMTSQLLNWYEEGTWTPGLAIGGATTGITYVVQSGNYVRVGKVVTVVARLIMSSIGALTGDATLTGLPFTTGAGGAMYGAGGPLTFHSGMAGAAAGTIFNMSGKIGSTEIGLIQGNAAVGWSGMSQGNFTNSSELTFSFTYISA